MSSCDAVQMILEGAGRQPMPTKSEQLHLARLVQQGLAPDATPKQRRAGDRARQRLVAGNARLVISIARRYRARIPNGSALGFEDLIQEGMLGLDTAARKFDPARGFSFSTYATWWVMQACGRALHVYSRTIRLPTSAHDICRRWRHKPPEQTLEQFAEQWNYKPEHVAWMLQQAAMTNATTLDQHATGHDDGATLGDLIAADRVDPLEHFDHQLAVEQLEAVLPADLELLEKQVVLGVKTMTLAAEEGVGRSALSHRIGVAKARLAAVGASFQELVA